MPASEFMRVALFVAAAYSVGVVCSYISRIIVDCISERGPRAIVFYYFAHLAPDKAASDCNRDDPRFVNDLAYEKKKCIKCPSVALWNAIYRSALRCTTRSDEVDRRRSQARFVRNLLIPVVLAPFVYCASMDCGLCAFVVIFVTAVIIALVGICATVFLYAYAEYVNFAEAYDFS